MSKDLYEKAKKLGLKAYRTNVSEGKYPFLPVLDDIINKDYISRDVNLGLVNIPLDRVIGTSTAGRTQAFASNFMPIMEANTEFSSKWSMLSDAHLDEGIRDPIKVYEYLNFYYVVEGNKRVSVLKYFEADSIPAFVTRKVPKLTDDKEIKIYYEYMDFNKKTSVNFILFTHEGCYKRLLNAVKEADIHGGEIGESPVISQVSTVGDSADGGGTAIRAEASLIWSEDTILELKAAYRRFEKAFKKRGGDHLSEVTTGDAFLTFVEVTGFDALCDMNLEEIETAISSMWQEFLVINEQYEVEVSLDPPPEKDNVITKIFSQNYTASKPLKVAFIYDKDPSNSNWLYQHELGRNHLIEVFGKKVSALQVTTAKSEEETIKAIESLIEEDGVEVIFTTTTSMISPSLKCAIKYPSVKILNCSLNTSHRYIRTYYARLYEAKFMSGMLAGALTQTDKIGYLADYPIYGITANINAFAIGARMMNPRVKVYLKWTTLKTTEHRDEIYHSFYEEGIDYVSDQDMITPRKASRKFGMYRLTDGDPENIIMTVYNWGQLYEKIINIIMKGNWGSTDAESESKPINYWWGLSSGVVDVILSEKIPYDLKRLVLKMRDMIINDEFSPFGGRIISQDGSLRSQDGVNLDIEDIIKMNWLVDNVIGSIPGLDELKDQAKQIVELKGIQVETAKNTDSTEGVD
ncbi:MAG: BMP family ABC transporter substrate-binding protein [Eubacterium sp.]|nr:BMP family ABC transporter substrate-binding protein [Eubacterium sp.]